MKEGVGASLIAGAILALGFGGLLWVSVGPPLSVEEKECVILEEPETNQNRRSISHTIETSCGTMSIDGNERWKYTSMTEIGESYTFTIEHRLFSEKVVSFE